MTEETKTQIPTLPASSGNQPVQIPNNQLHVQDLFTVMKLLADISQQKRLTDEETNFVKPAFDRLDSFLKIVENDMKTRAAKNVTETQTDLLDLPKES